MENIDIVKEVKIHLDFKNFNGSYLPKYAKLSEFYKILSKEQKFILLEWISEDFNLEMKEIEDNIKLKK